MIISVIMLISVIAMVLYVSVLSPVNMNHISYIYIDDDDNIDSVCGKADEILPGISGMMFHLMTAASSYKDHIHTGRYEITPSTSALDLFIAVRGHRTVPVTLVVPSTRTLSDLAKRLSCQLMIDSATLEDFFTDEKQCSRLGFTKESITAFFIPETYEIYWDASTDRLLEKLKNGYEQFWNDNRRRRAAEINLTPIEVSVLASIVESETAVVEEMPRVAGLYMNRLHRDMLLQSCPTVIFAIGDFSIKRVLKNHLKTDSPYNTYIYKGLPPGPIRIPSVAAIDAVLNYEHHDFIFMCAKEDLSGTHDFASNSTEHQKNARKYQRALNQRGIRQ